MRRLLVLLCAFTLTACVTVTNPIGASVGYRSDAALEGLWLSVPDRDKGATYAHVLLNADNTMTVVGVAPRHGDDKASWGTLTLTTVTLGDNRYMNVRETSEDGVPKSDDGSGASIPLLYRIDGDTLSLLRFDEKPVEAAIAAHNIAGTVDKSQYGTTVTITADPAALDAWLRSPDAPELFAPVLKLHRVK